MSRVVYFDHTAVPAGAELALCTLLGALDRRRWDPYVILGAPGAIAERLRTAGIAVEVLALPGSLGTPGRAGTRRMVSAAGAPQALAYVRRLAARLRELQAGLVHTNSLRACVLGGLAARLVRIPCVWQVHSVIGRPMVSGAGVRMLRALARWLPSHVICNSQATAARLPIRQGRMTVIPPGVDARRFAPNERAWRVPPRIGLIARMTPLKGQHVFIEAAERLHEKRVDAEFVLAGAPLFGEDDYAAGIHELTRRSSSGDRIRFLGFVDDVPALLRELDVVVHASTLPEGFGQTVVEAMLAGKPVIATAAGGSADLVEDGVTGRLVPPGDAEAMAEAIESVIHDPDKSAAMAQRARERALGRYQACHYAQAVDSVYRRVLAPA